MRSTWYPLSAWLQGSGCSSIIHMFSFNLKRTKQMPKLLAPFTLAVPVWKSCQATWAGVMEPALEPSTVWSIHKTCLLAHAHNYSSVRVLHTHSDVLSQAEHPFVKANCLSWYRNTGDLYEGSEKRGFTFHTDSKAGTEQSPYTGPMQAGYVQVI